MLPKVKVPTSAFIVLFCPTSTVALKVTLPVLTFSVPLCTVSAPGSVMVAPWGSRVTVPVENTASGPAPSEASDLMTVVPSCNVAVPVKVFLPVRPSSPGPATIRPPPDSTPDMVRVAP